MTDWLLRTMGIDLIGRRGAAQNSATRASIKNNAHNLSTDCQISGAWLNVEMAVCILPMMVMHCWPTLSGYLPKEVTDQQRSLKPIRPVTEHLVFTPLPDDKCNVNIKSKKQHEGAAVYHYPFWTRARDELRSLVQSPSLYQVSHLPFIIL